MTTAEPLPLPESPPADDSQRRCPQCGSARVRRSQRRGLRERYLLALRGLRPYRCKECDHRFYARRSGH